MALIKCPECGNEISDSSKKCVHCGFKFKNKKNTKIIIVITIVVVLLSAAGFGTYWFIANQNPGSSVSKEDLSKLENETFSMISTASDNSIDACSTILEVWSNSGSRDFNEVFEYMFSGDVKNHEWSGLGMDKDGFSSISWGYPLSNKMNNFYKTLNSLKSEKSRVDEQMLIIKDSKSDKIDEIVDYYNAYLKLYNAAVSPSGNQLNYSSNLISYKNELNSARTNFEMKK